MAMQPTGTTRPFLLMWWDFEQQEAKNIVLPFVDAHAAWNWMLTIPGLDSTKRIGAFPR